MRVRNGLFLVFSFAALVLTAQLGAQSVPDALVKAGRSLDPRAGNLLTTGAVLIEADKIGEVGAPAKAQADHAPADMVYARPGQLIDAGGFRLNLRCMGSGSPTVVFDSGWGDWSPAWSKVQPQIATWTRACSYDRAGTGLSDPGPMPRTSARIAGELRTALHHAGIAGPYILVGSAFGGDHVRAFADLYTSEVAGLVFVDADAATSYRRPCKWTIIGMRLRSLRT